jgi:hypothetical protein
METPELPKGYYFQISPGFTEFEFMSVEHYTAAVQLYKKGFFGSTRVVSISIPNTSASIHPTEEQLLKAMKTAALYAL